MSGTDTTIRMRAVGTRTVLTMLSPNHCKKFVFRMAQNGSAIIDLYMREDSISELVFTTTHRVLREEAVAKMRELRLAKYVVVS